MFCAVGLIYSTTELILQYRSGQTVVDVRYDIRSFDKIPGITVCYPVAISMDRVAKRFPSQKMKMFEEYVNRFKSGEDLQKVLILENFMNFLTIIIPRSGENLTLNEIFNLTIPFDLQPDDTYPIEVIVTGIHRIGDGPINSSKLVDKSPVESVFFKQLGIWEKCFTFFSHTTGHWKDYEMVVERIYIKIQHNYTWFPENQLKTLKLSMHSPAELPQHDIHDYIELTPNIENNIAFNTWTNKLLGKKWDFLWTRTFKPICLNYDRGNSQYEKRMRSNCLKGCIQNEMNRCIGCGTKFNGSCDKCLHFTPDLWISQDFDETGISLFCSFINTSLAPDNQTDFCRTEKLMEILYECNKDCPLQCEHRHYTYQKWDVSQDNRSGNETHVLIVHNLAPDRFTEHSPKMTFIDFASAFGGLMGIWMGLSALAIFKYLFKLVFK